MRLVVDSNIFVGETPPTWPCEQYGVPQVTMDQEIRNKAPGRIFVLDPREVISRLA